jgi:hypothetical protein
MSHEQVLDLCGRISCYIDLLQARSCRLAYHRIGDCGRCHVDWGPGLFVGRIIRSGRTRSGFLSFSGKEWGEDPVGGAMIRAAEPGVPAADNHPIVLRGSFPFERASSCI